VSNPFPVRNIQNVLVQTASGGLPDSDSGWVTQYWLRFESGSEGAGQIMGEAVLQQRFGIVTNQNDPVQVVTGTAPAINGGGIDDGLVGQLVRLIVADDAGSISIRDGDGVNSYAAFWWGVVSAFSVEPDNRDNDNAGGTATWRCVGILSVLDKITVNSGFVMQIGGDGWVDPGYFPPFNDLPGGDMSATDMAVGNGSASVHDLSTLNAATPWTMAQEINLLLTGCANPVVNGDITGWTWNYSDDDGVLDFQTERIDINGLTVLQALATIANQKRGVTWRAIVNGSTVTIAFSPGNRYAITIGDQTFPASTNTASYVAAGNLWTYGLVISEDDSSTYDIIECRGAHPWVGLTVDFSDADETAIDSGWTSEDETNWNGDINYPGTDNVYRRFVFTTTWSGNQFGSTTVGIRNSLTTDGSGQFTGERTYDAESPTVPPTMYQMERMLPCGTVFEQLGTARLAPFQPPVVVCGSAANTWFDYSQNARIEPQSFPSGVYIDVDKWKGLTIADRIDNGEALLVTLGFREPQPLRVNWIADPSTWPTSTPRIKMIDVPNIEQWILLDGSITGVSNDLSTTTKVSGDQVMRDDTVRLQQILALAVSRYGYASVTAAFSEAAILDFSATLAPAVLLTDVVTGTDDVDVNAVITRRSWKRVVRDGVDMYDTTYETTRVMPDVEAVI
jgi:hypothetical protein